ncbi:MAG: hypothetical protein A2458_00855 [Candidatus Kerfeldbacteria bacterium RIFOXYC2_FULL_38_9]|uniref:Uncharacterized protein n=1 Tax=Candidatus Kerfeldbacteria bacterium RIFOXYB2_FULL_38_14 TaxID=1798547 RepID=A0A1G2BBI9_9BACT|nr:MAG: hypothetical protein A2319_02025 [Candidatus Kerfeldbacteria bacterium RIFOXYB2_FULL_38_14]OGY89274.1 MAG: hypothetical protein A2458_00855 [Candidatus Kerfeldbacteria bacterium RIFOXYC2_FULL_38_9]
MKKLMQKISSVVAATVGGVFLVRSAALAQINTNYTDVKANLGDRDLRDIVQLAINVFLSLLALIAVVLILVGGFQWMTAGGNDEKVGAAKKRLISALIGLVIIFAAWAIVLFAFSQISSATETKV